VLSRLSGTYSFHNFSPGFADATDPKSVRSVYRCRSAISAGQRDVLLGRDFAVLRITGRSFLYRQILGMAGLTIAITAGIVPLTYLDLALGQQGGIEIPTAPAGNLVLARCSFRDGAFTAPTNKAEVSLTRVLEDEMAGDAMQGEFSKFCHDLKDTIGPRMRTLLKVAARDSVGDGHTSGVLGDPNQQTADLQEPCCAQEARASDLEAQ